MSDPTKGQNSTECRARVFAKVIVDPELMKNYEILEQKESSSQNVSPILNSSLSSPPNSSYINSINNV